MYGPSLWWCSCNERWTVRCLSLILNGGKMAEWMYDRRGSACLIIDRDRIRDRTGSPVAWISRGSVYSRRGRHVGWYEGGVMYDDQNRALAFTRNRIIRLPSTPELIPPPDLPMFSSVPTRPVFSYAPKMPPRGGWSSEDAAMFFSSTDQELE
jgi:hypothetical protein